MVKLQGCNVFVITSWLQLMQLMIMNVVFCSCLCVCVCAHSSVFSVYVHACVCEGRGMLYAFVVKWIRDTVCDVVIVRVRKQRLR